MPTKDDERNRWLLQHHMVEDNLEELAAKVRNIYTRFRRQLFPTYYVNTKKHHKKFWWDTARFLVDRDIDVEEFVSICFDVMGAKTLPEMLKSESMIDRYQQNKKPIYDRAASLLRLYAGKLRRAIDNDPRTLEQILDDPRNDFGKLFIWCIATIEGLPELADKNVGSARRLLLNPAYRKAYSDAFPEVVQ